MKNLKKFVRTGVIFAVALLIILMFIVGTGFNVYNRSDEIKYCGYEDGISESETINYSRREVVEYSIKEKVPAYISQNSVSNCANIAGAILVGYYDRFCEDLIPNYKSYTQLGSIVTYKGISSATEQVVKDLYEMMGTDVGSAGTTFSGFQTGMNTYVSSHNYTYKTSYIGAYNYNEYISSINSNSPIAVFLTDYSLVDNFQDSGKSETINSSHSSVAHIVVCYGYAEINYYNSNNGLITQRRYLLVSSGLTQIGLCYLCLDDKSTIDKSISVIIE